VDTVQDGCSQPLCANVDGAVSSVETDGFLVTTFAAGKRTRFQAPSDLCLGCCNFQLFSC
jgi:hypothetical protein